MKNATRFVRRVRAIPLLAICAFIVCGASLAFVATAQNVSAGIAAVEIVLPARIVANQSATLAVLGADRKLAAHVAVSLGNGKRVQTDATGRFTFTAPVQGVVVARSGAVSAATVVDPAPDSAAQRDVIVGPFASLRGQFSICGGGFHGDAEGDQVQVSGQPALILAASPECILVVPSPKTPPGRATILVKTDEATRQASTTIVSLEFEPPEPPLAPRRRGWLTVRARGSDQRLHVLVENETPDVLRFERGDAQDVATSGGRDNTAEIRVQAIRSGDFSFHARVLPPADLEAARRFLEAAEPLAIADVPHTLKSMENELRHQSPDSEKIRAQLDQMLLVTSPSDFRTLLEAARSAL